MENKKCYRCDTIATSYEHIPAKSFFPKKNRTNLITVPSCKRHNQEKSGDDEYFRNLLCMSFNLNDLGKKNCQDKVLRALERNDSFLAKQFSENSEIINYDGQPTAKIKIDKQRIADYMAGISYGLYRHDFKENYIGNWSVVIDFRNYDFGIESSLKPKEKKMRSVLQEIPFPKSESQNPGVFQYSYAGKKEELIYRFIFYEKIFIYSMQLNVILESGRLPSIAPTVTPAAGS